MQQITINIPDKAYATAKKRAQREGFDSTEIFLSDLIVNSVVDQPDKYDHLFTPDVIAAIDKGAQEIKDGKSMTRAQVSAYLAEKRME